MAAEGSALNYAGRAYKRECGWDFFEDFNPDERKSSYRCAKSS
jgi:hypothetical protein